MSLVNTSEIAFGLDISDRNLRLVQLTRNRKKNKIQIFSEVGLPPNCIEAGEIKNNKLFLDSLRQLIKNRCGSGKLSDEVISVLPESKTFLKLIEMPLTEDQQLAEKIKEVLPLHVPINVEDNYIDWQLIEKKTDSQTMLVGASPKKIIDSYVSLLTSANLIPTVLEIEAAAVSRLLIEQNNERVPQIIIDIGANRTGLFLYNHNTIQFTVSLPISGDQITKTIMETLDLDFDQAEKAKIICGLDQKKCQGALLEIFADSLAELTDQIKQAQEFYQANFGDAQPAQKILLCGGGANLLNIAQVLEQKTGLATAVSDPWKNLANPDPKFFNQQKSQSFITAIGLALRGIAPETFL